MEARLHRWLPVLLVGLAMVAAAAAAAGGGLSGEILPPPQEEAVPPEPETSAAPASAGPDLSGGERPVEADYPWWLTWPVTVLFLALVVVCVGLFLYAGIRYLLTERVVQRELIDQRASQPDGGLVTEPLRDALRAGLADIDAGGDPRRAVIACWLRLERIAAAAGTARLAADTPADLVGRLLSAHRVGGHALAGLAEAYRRARYAPAEVGDQLVETARRALAEVDAELRGRAIKEPRR